MNRRNFFKKLSGAIVGAYVACQVKLPEEWVVNPAWHNAEYELFVIGAPPHMNEFDSKIFQFLPSLQDYLTADGKSFKRINSL